MAYEPILKCPVERDLTQVNLSIAPHKDRIAELSAPKEAAELFTADSSEGATTEYQSPRNQLLIAIGLLGSLLVLRPHMVGRVAAPDFTEVKRRALEDAMKLEGKE